LVLNFTFAVYETPFTQLIGFLFTTICYGM
jgi:hypothetical protein